MDPWLEHPALWPDVHNSLIAAIRDELSPRLAPRYYVGLEQRTLLIDPNDLGLYGIPDLAILTTKEPSRPAGPFGPAGLGVIEVEVMVSEEVHETYLEVRSVKTRQLVTLIEVLSPANKVFAKGRRKYELKRNRVIHSLTSLVEIDLLRAGEPHAEAVVEIGRAHV